MANKPVYVIGHKNPDPDSICSAIGYAAFKRAQGFGQYVPARCGNSNARIDAILEHFKVPLPVFVGDVTPRVRDIMRERPHTLSPAATCAEALEQIDRYDIRALPVVKADGTLQGMVTIFGLGEFFVPKLKELKELRRVHTSISALVRSLKGRALHLEHPDREEDIFLRVGAMDLSSFRRFAEKEGIAPEQSGIIVGDRRDIQLCAIGMGVRLLVTTGNAEPDDQVVAQAQNKGVCVLVSPYDTATTAWIIRTATFARRLMETQVRTWSAEEKLSVLRRRIAQMGDSALECVADAQGRLLGVFTRGDLLQPMAQPLVLVDHNELSQAVSGAQEAEILEIIDHHRLGNTPTLRPILFHNEPVGATSTIVAGFFRESGIIPQAEIAGVLMGGIISDTMHLRSPTTTPKDREMLAWLAPHAQTDSGALAQLIFNSGSLISKIAAEAVITADCKRYEEGKARFSVAQVEELGFDRFREHTDSLAQALENYRRQEGLLFSCLLVTDINMQNSLLLLAAEEDLRRAVSYPQVDAQGRVFDLAGVVSRKKQLIPYLTGLVGLLGLS